MARIEKTLGAIVNSIRKRNNWTLREMSGRVGIPLSTLAKVEVDRLTLTYEKLQQLAARLGLTLSEMLAEGSPSGITPPAVTARRSVASVANSMKVVTPNYEYSYLFSDLREKRMVPIISSVTTKSIANFGPLASHPGEEFVYVIEGSIEVHTQFYSMTVLSTGQSVYIDSTMGHAYVTHDCDEAVILTVCSSEHVTLADELIQLAKEEANPPKR